MVLVLPALRLGVATNGVLVQGMVLVGGGAGGVEQECGEGTFTKGLHPPPSQNIYPPLSRILQGCGDLRRRRERLRNGVEMLAGRWQRWQMVADCADFFQASAILHPINNIQSSQVCRVWSLVISFVLFLLQS